MRLFSPVYQTPHEIRKISRDIVLLLDKTWFGVFHEKLFDILKSRSDMVNQAGGIEAHFFQSRFVCYVQLLPNAEQFTGRGQREPGGLEMLLKPCRFVDTTLRRIENWLPNVKNTMFFSNCKRQVTFHSTATMLECTLCVQTGDRADGSWGHQRAANLPLCRDSCCKDTVPSLCRRMEDGSFTRLTLAVGGRGTLSPLQHWQHTAHACSSLMGCSQDFSTSSKDSSRGSARSRDSPRSVGAVTRESPSSAVLLVDLAMAAIPWSPSFTRYTPRPFMLSADSYPLLDVYRSSTSAAAPGYHSTVKSAILK